MRLQLVVTGKTNEGKLVKKEYLITEHNKATIYTAMTLSKYPEAIPWGKDNIDIDINSIQIFIKHVDSGSFIPMVSSDMSQDCFKDEDSIEDFYMFMLETIDKNWKIRGEYNEI